MQDSEDWEDFQAIESKACRVLNHIFAIAVRRIDESSCDDNGGCPIYVTRDPARPLEYQSFTQLVSSIDRENSEYKVLYVTAERIARNLLFVDILNCLHNKGQLAGFIINEVHCVSRWGHNFRPKL